MQTQKKKFEQSPEDSHETSNEKLRSKEKAKDKKKLKLKKKKRLIVRNLSFQVTDEELRQTFSKFGTVLEVNIPLKNDGKKRGFAFVQYESTKSLIKAMKVLNNSEIHGRRVAIDYAVDKTSYQLKLQSIKQEKDAATTSEGQVDSDSESESEDKKPETDFIEEDSPDIDEKEKKANEFLRDFDSGFETLENDEDDSSDESSVNDSDPESEDQEETVTLNKGKKSNQISEDASKERLQSNKKQSNDVSEGKTVFLRNVSFSTSNDSLKEALEQYGECEYCVICVDPVTDHSKGTAFVKFKSKECADKLIQESWGDPGVVVDGRKLMCASAISREVISLQKDDSKKPKDKRNLYLLKVGIIMPDSKESEGVSRPDMVKRSQLEMVKKQKLRNVNFFVSDKRLMISNLPKTLTDVELRKLFKQAAGKGAVITEARVMKEFKKTNSEGKPLSKGFGFVSFNKHEDALKALSALNNNPEIFTAQKRPIVEFSVENKVALLSKERRKEKIQQRNKKRTEEKQERQSSITNKNKKEVVANTALSKQGKKSKRKRKNESEKDVVDKTEHLETGSPRKKHKKGKKTKLEETNTKFSSNNVSQSDSQISENNSTKKHKKQKKNKKPKKKGATPDHSSQENFHNMVNKFKEKLLNKM